MKKTLTFRIRTIVLTAILIGSLIFYFLVQTIFKKTLNWIDFIMLASVQIITHFLYYPDGELNGQKDPIFIQNKAAYNIKANLVNKKRQIKNLEDYCEEDYQERCKEYILTNFGYISLDWNDYVYLKANIDKIDLKGKYIEIQGRILYLTRYNKKILKKILFKKIPVEKNNVSTIMSATEVNRIHSIKDESKNYTFAMHMKKLIMATVVGAFLAYVGYKKKDSFGLEDLVLITIDVSSIIATAVLSYSSGERAYKHYKNDFYVQLDQLLARFFEYLYSAKKISIETYQPQEIELEKNEEIEYNKDVGLAQETY